MQNPLLVGLRDQDQMDKVLSSLQEIVESGTSVVFSFSTSGRVTVLLASAPIGAKVTKRCGPVDRSVNQKPIAPSSKEKEIR
jgi:hypothetical protein